MIRTTIAIIGAIALVCSAANGQGADGSIRFVVSQPSSVTIERTATGGLRITIEPLSGELPVPPKPDPSEPDVIADALAGLPEAERRNVALLFKGRAEVAQDPFNLSAFQSSEECSSWLLTGVLAQLGEPFIERYIGSLNGLAFALTAMPGDDLAAKLAAYRERLGEPR